MNNNLSHWRHPAAVEVQNRLLQALALLRVVFLANAIGLNWYRQNNFVEPGYAVAAIVLMLVWTGVALVAYRSEKLRRWPLLGVDLLVAVLLMVSSSWLKGPDFQATVPGFWISGALFAWAIIWRWPGGLFASVTLAATDILIRPEIDQSNYGNAFLIFIGGPIIGYLCQSLMESAVARDQAERAAAAAHERARLARVVHDGVLQVLSLVQRKGQAAGGEFGELARLAREQETLLRGLVQTDVTAATRPPDADTDLMPAIGELSQRLSLSIEVVGPGRPVLLDLETVDGARSVVWEALTNISRHVGETATAHIFVDDLGDSVTISIRDDGPGIAEGRLAEASRTGRLGVSESIVGRTEALGGQANLETGPTGSEWEIMLPRRLL
jgi:signal transduction histidine kinase